MSADAPERLHENSDAVQAHLNIAQSVINRMANNSAASKGWCIAIVSALLVVAADKPNSRIVLIALMPTGLFLALDAYYLSLERRFRASYNSFIEKLHSRGVKAADLYAIVPAGGAAESIVGAIASFSVWPFYATLTAAILLVWNYVL